MENFAIYICSYGRAKDIRTLNMIKKYHYSGHYYVVCSTDDDQIELYKALIPEKNLLVFDKMDYVGKFDSYAPSNIGKSMMKSVIYARNFIVQHAKKVDTPHLLCLMTIYPSCTFVILIMKVNFVLKK